MVKLIVHIGHGKTGSTSIQQSLLSAQAELAEQGVHYLGIMLEHTHAAERKKWQHVSGSDHFFGEMPESVAISELHDVLDRELKTLNETGVKTAIWSNEWILERPQKVLSTLKSLVGKNIEIEILVYLRRHDNWAISAYTQWGLRHKTYPGPVVPFEEWSRRRGPGFATYYGLLRPWLDSFPETLRVLNFDCSGDVTQHFLALNGIEKVRSQSENILPTSEVLAGHAVFNNAKIKLVTPQEFEKVVDLADGLNENRSNVLPLDRLMPDGLAITAFLDARKHDIEAVNELLVQSGEPPLSFETPTRKIDHPSPWEMDQFTLKLVYALIEKTGQLEKKVAALQAQLNDRHASKGQ